MFEAARITDPIAHTSALAGFLVGALIGVALIAAVAFATFTCGFGVALLAGMAAGLGASAILGIGEAIGKSITTPSGMITSGSPNVWINRLGATFATAGTVACDKHNPMQLIAEGSGNVYINSLPAARKKDAITCGAKIDDGSSNVFIGGGTVPYLPVEDEIPEALRTTVDVAFTLAGLAGGLGGLVKAGGGLSRALLPCAAKFIAGFAIGEAVSRYVIAPVVSRALGGLFGNPVDMATGRKVLLAQNEVDAVLNGPIPLVCSRFYGSNLAFEGSLGKGWVLPWDLRLQQRDGKLWLTDGQGRETGFPLVEPGHTAFSEAEQRYLACTRDGQYIAYDLNEQYHDFGFLDASGDDIAWVQRVEDRTGQWHAFVRDDSDRVVTIRTSSGQQVQLHYSDAPSRLRRIECMHGGTRGTLVEYGYDALDQLVTVTDAYGNIARKFSYADGLMASHTSALGFTCSYVWAEIDGTPRVVSARNSEGEQTTFSYAPESRESWATDDEGRVAHWVYDEHFQITECTDLDGATYKVQYNEAGMPVTIALPGERKVSFEYDAAARIIAETDPLGRTTHTIYDGNSLRVKEVALCDGCRWRSEFDDLGRLTATIDPLGRTDRYDYGPGPNPFPLVHVDARGGKKTMQWDRRGQLLAYTDCSGKVTTYSYDADGGLASVTDALGQVTRYERMRTGELVKVTLADGSTEEFTYDAARLLVEQRSGTLETRHWARNARGQVVQSVDPARRQLRYRFDSHGRLVEMSSDSSTRYVFGYDRGDRLAHELRPDGVERHLRYDDAGELRSIEMVGHLPGAAPAQARPRRTTLFERDAMGRLLAQATETGTDAYVWSDGDRLLEAARTPTPLGESLGIAPAAVRFEYDKAGRVLAEHGAEGVVGFAFDDLDNMTQLHLPHGQHIDLLSYGAGHVHQIRAADRVISDFERDDLHREIERTQGALTQRVGYDALGRRSWQAAGIGREAPGPGQGRLWRSYRYHPSGELAEQRDSIRGAIEYQYDPAGQLKKQVRNVDQQQEQFAWDAAGNLLDELGRKSRGQVAGNRLLVWQDLRFEYDAWGNLRTKRKGAHQIQHFSFDAADRLISVRTENQRGTSETRFEYDPLGRRIATTDTVTETTGRTSTRTRRFVWEGMRMAQEVRESGVSSYVYSPDATYTPLARIDSTIAAGVAGAAAGDAVQVFHFHTDLTGAPLEVTDESGQLAWAGKYHAWGKIDRGEDEALAARIEQPLRYPGQYADEGTGLHYNTFRFYDPDIGRYISPDPIGMDGGHNLYAYAPNPTSWIDPLGWLTFPPNSPDLFPVTGGQSNIVEITMQGSRSRDFTAAYKAAGITKKAAAGYTWHHVDDFDPRTGKTTMQLVKTDGIHQSTSHKGSVSQFEKHFKVDYDTTASVARSQKKGWLTGRAPRVPRAPATPQAGC